MAYGSPLDPQDFYDQRRGQLILDVGFGLGDSLIHLASTRPDCNVLGVELLPSGIAQALQSIHERNLTNCKVVKADLRMLLQPNYLSGNCLFDEIYVLFPDPWPNAVRDADKRVIRPEVVQLFERVLRKKGGLLRVSTDVAEMAKWVEDVMASRPPGIWDPKQQTRSQVAPPARPRYRPETKYEKIAQFEGRTVIDLEFVREAAWVSESTEL